MLRRVTLLLLCLMAMLPTAVRATVTPTVAMDSLRVSLLTVSAGAEVYERFGHTAIRIQGLPHREDGLPLVAGYADNVELELPYSQLPRYNRDLVFHYGVFNFRAPHFVYRFVKGETDYSIGCLPYEIMLQDYESRGLRVTEQELQLSPDEARALLFRLLINNLSYNRKYRYSFFFDNCATRPFRLIDAATDSAIVYNRTLHTDLTLRDMLREKTGRNTWLDFGISLVIAGRADEVATFEEQMFLPDYLMEAYENAEVQDSTNADGEARRLVGRTQVVVSGNPQLRAALAEEPCWWTSPTACGWALLVVVALLTFRSHGGSRLLRAVDCALLLATGLAGVMVWFLNFYSLHPAVDHNWNCLWLVPFNLLFAVLIWIKCCKKLVNFYFLITFVALIVYLLSCGFTRQFVHPAFVPMVLALALRWGVNCGAVKIEIYHHARRRPSDQEINI
jgi:hypothetical protein